MSLINGNRVEEILKDCLFSDPELKRSDDGEIESMKIPADAVKAEGIMNTFMFNRARLEARRDEITEMLMNLPEPFRATKGGGWSFLSACQDRNDEQWTGLHLRMDQLFVLGIAIGRAKFLMPRSMWAAMPGGMPYLVIEDRDPVPAPAG
jgi:hypothetical protein